MILKNEICVLFFEDGSIQGFATVELAKQLNSILGDDYMILEVGTEIIGSPYDEFKVYDKHGKFLFEVFDPEFNEMVKAGEYEILI